MSNQAQKYGKDFSWAGGAFDWRVGEDKKLGKNRDDAILFYTSLAPWKKDASDMRDFGTFLKLWGWNL